MRRRLLPLLPVLLVTGALAGAPASASVAPRAADDGCPASVQEDGFPDVPASDPHESAVDCVVHWGIAQGRSDDAYGPHDLVRRDQMASFLARLVERSGGTLPAASRDWFADDRGDVHAADIDRLAEAGVVTGRAPGVFGPADLVTRAQMAALVVRAYDERVRQAGRAGLPAGDDAFPDDDTSPLQEQIDTAAAAGVVGGYPDGTYRPGLGVPRDQMATFLARVLDLLVEGGVATVPPGPRSLTDTQWRPYATVGPVVLSAPGELVEVVGFHQSGSKGALRQEPVAGAVPTVVLPSRSRGTDLQSAADIVVDPSREVRSPVTGTVKRSGNYSLYCKYPDQFLVVEPDSRPGWEVKLLHFEGLRVSAGQRVEAGVTVVGDHARILPFWSQVNEHTAAPHWSHVHVEVDDPSVPTSGGGC